MENLTNNLPIIMVLIYLMVVVYIGIIKPLFNNKNIGNETFEEFYTGSKSLPSFIIGMIMIVTMYSGSTFTGKLGFIVKFGVVGAYTVPYQIIGGLVFYYLAEKVWPLGKKYRLSTMADFIELRYQNKYLKLLTGLSASCLNIPWLTLEVMTIGIILNIATNNLIPIKIGSLLAVLLIMAYLITSGVKAVSIIDTISAIIMFTGSVIVLAYILNYYYDGSLNNLWITVFENSPEHLILPSVDSTLGQWQFWISWTVCGVLGYLVWPANYMQIYLGKDLNAARKTGIITGLGGLFNLVYIVMAFAIIGLATGAYSELFSGVDPEHSLLEILKLSGNPLIYGILTTSMFAITVGTMDSTLLAVSGLFSNDVIGTIKRIKDKDEHIGEKQGERAQKERVEKNSNQDMKITRLIIILVGLIAYGVSLLELPMMVFVAGYVYQGIIQLVPYTVGGIYWEKSNVKGAFSGYIAGMTVFILGNLHTLGQGYFGGVFPGVLGVIVNTIVFILVSNLTYKKGEMLRHIEIDFFGLN